MKTRLLFRILIVAVALVVVTAAARSAEIRVMSSVGVRGPLEELRPVFETKTGDTLAITFATAADLKKRIEAAPNSFDVAILTPNAVAELASKDLIDPSTVYNLGTVGIGLAVRSGAKRPDLTDESAFWGTLLRAKSVAYASDGASGIYFLKLLGRQGIDMAEIKLVGVSGTSPLDLVASGRADLGVQLVSEIKANKGVDLAGAIPEAFQNYTTMTLGLARGTNVHVAAKKFGEFLGSRQAAERLAAYGFKRVE